MGGLCTQVKDTLPDRTVSGTVFSRISVLSLRKSPRYRTDIHGSTDYCTGISAPARMILNRVSVCRRRYSRTHYNRTVITPIAPKSARISARNLNGQLDVGFPRECMDSCSKICLLYCNFPFLISHISKTIRIFYENSQDSLQEIVICVSKQGLLIINANIRVNLY